MKGVDTLHSGESGNKSSLVPHVALDVNVEGDGTTNGGKNVVSIQAPVEENNLELNIMDCSQGGTNLLMTVDVGKNSIARGPADMLPYKVDVGDDTAVMEDVVPAKNVRNEVTKTNLRKWKRQARVPKEGTDGASHSALYKRKAQNQEVGDAGDMSAKKTCTDEVGQSSEIMESAAAAMQPRQSQ